MSEDNDRLVVVAPDPHSDRWRWEVWANRETYEAAGEYLPLAFGFELTRDDAIGAGQRSRWAFAQEPEIIEDERGTP